MRDVLLFLTGYILGIILFFFLLVKLNNTADIINVIGIFVNVGIAVLVGFFIQSKLMNSRYLKEYYINQIENTRVEYDEFLKKIRDNKLNRKEILKEFKFFSMKITELDYSLNNNLKIKNSEIQVNNRVIHQLITNSIEFNSTVTNSKVVLKNLTLNQLLDHHKGISRIFTNIVYAINSK